MIQGWVRFQAGSRVFSFGSIALLVFAAFGSVNATARISATEYDKSVRYSITVDEVQVNEVELDGRNWLKAKLVGVEGHEGILYREGSPEIPVIRLYVDGASEIRIDYESSESKSFYSEKVKLAPVQRSAPKIRGASTAFRFDAAAYQSQSFYPAQPYTVEEAGWINGKRRQLVTLHPLSYNPATQELVFRNAFSVEVRRDSLEAEAKTAGRTFAFVVGKRFVNSPSLVRYIEFKRSQGFHVEVIKVGTDASTPDEIRGTLKRLLADQDRRLAHVLIIGDADDVPGYRTRTISGITDHYYRAIDTDSYDADINGPDVSVGRFPAANEEHLDAMVSKSIKYALGSFGRRDWLRHASWLATDDRWQMAEATHNYAIETYTAAEGYTGVFPHSPIAGGDQLYAITHRVPRSQTRSTLSSGRSLIQYSGHGANTFWDAPRVDQADVRSLRDPDALPFVVSNACITGDYRVSESFAETWIRHPYGAILFWGSMDNTYWDEDDILERRQYDGMFREGLRVFSEITDYALSQHWLHYGGEGRSKYYWETYTVFGDPSLAFRDSRDAR